ncbi:MAG: aminopeptidase P N-terminal domain-containing protein [Cardiobacteriaceae bacterium]|nr:aminopeptidase P N-terminal domain-containing protein [Cardiobacteriaceae bacterium]
MHRELFAQRRESLFELLPEGSAVVLYAGHELTRNNDVHYPFRQESYFWYYTGFPEPDAVAVLTKLNHKVHYRLYNMPRNPLRELWEGKIIGQEGAVEHYGASESLPLSELGGLASFLADCRHVYTILGVSQHQDERASALLREIHQLSGRGGAAISGLQDLRRLADEMRLYKSADELITMQIATDISVKGHLAAMQAAKEGKFEYHVQAAVEHAFREHGCHWSFPTIVASGANACCLHYRENNALLRAGDLLLVDAGAEYQYYAGDLTRTFPINGRFSYEQRTLYEAVLAAQEAAIAKAKVGVRHLEVHEATTRALTQALLDAKVIEHDMDYWLENDRYKAYYPHGTGHWLGMDVHDVGTYKVDGLSRTYEDNMVITIEPGVYIQLNDTQFAEKWRGIGIRIEDDVRICSSGGKVLSSALPKTAAEIEAYLS